MKTHLSSLKNITSDNCVTIILNTHRTKPDNQKDPINLKNLIKEAEDRLMSIEKSKKNKQIVSQIKDLEAKIDHSKNLESLILFVNEDVCEYVRLPIKVVDRVIIDSSFATRDLIRSINEETAYYVLVLSQQKVRLIEAFNDKLMNEEEQLFPIENTQFFSTSGAQLSNAPLQTKLIAEFFNRIDKTLSKIIKQNPLPVLLCTEESNYFEFLKVSENKNRIYDTFLNKNRTNEKAQAIVSEAWKIVHELTIKNNGVRKNELESAVGAGKFLSDLNDVWKAVFEGRIKTIFIEQGLFQSAYIENNTIIVSEWKNEKNMIDDIYDEILEANLKHGGDVVFLPKGELGKFNGFGAVTRY